jgi:hypothetical protein
MNRHKQFRAVATRFNKLAVRYQATVCGRHLHLAARQTGPAPRRSENHALVELAGQAGRCLRGGA